MSGNAPVKLSRNGLRGDYSTLVAKDLPKRRSRLVVTAPLQRTYPRRVGSSKTSQKPTYGQRSLGG